VVLVAIDRAGTLIVPSGDVELRPRDRLTMLAAPSAVAAARALLSGDAAAITRDGVDDAGSPPAGAHDRP